MHHVLPRNAEIDHATVEYNDVLIPIDEGIRKILTDRLSQSFGQHSKSFVLDIENDQEGSVFDFVKNIALLSDREFIGISHRIADMLADAQGNKGNVPGGYLLIVDCADHVGNRVYVLMKAESHNALNIVENSAQALQNIILSPAQKLYKSAIFEQIGNTHPLTKNDFKVHLFDSQFNSGTKLASYFYKEFLGLTISGNAPIETRNFYYSMMTATEKAFGQSVDTFNNIKDNLISLLTSQSATINPHSVIVDIIPGEQRDLYIRMVANEFEGSFVKDVSLLSHQLNNRIVKFDHGLKLSGPTNIFNNDIVTIENDDIDPSIKVIKIKTNAAE